MSTTQKNDLRLLKADLYRLLANCFDFPSGERLAAIREISGALAEAGYPDEEIQSLLYDVNTSMDENRILNDYSRIFIKGGVPLNESHTLKKFNSVSDVNAFYHAFGFSPKSGDNPDSVMYELEFLALLLLKITIAPDEEAGLITQKAYKDFLNEHAGAFAVALARRIREGDAGTYFITIALLLEMLMNKELAKLNAE